MNLLLILLILLLTVAALGLVVYYLMRSYFKEKKAYLAFANSFREDSGILPERLQAYERLMLFLDRISVPQLLLRMASNETHPEGLRNALMIAVQKEYEYNAPQQLYFSDEMWQIITLAKDDTLAFIQEVAALPEVSGAAELQALLLSRWGERSPTPTDMAQKALRKEAALYIR